MKVKKFLKLFDDTCSNKAITVRGEGVKLPKTIMEYRPMGESSELLTTEYHDWKVSSFYCLHNVIMLTIIPPKNKMRNKHESKKFIKLFNDKISDKTVYVENKATESSEKITEYTPVGFPCKVLTTKYHNQKVLYFYSIENAIILEIDSKEQQDNI